MSSQAFCDVTAVIFNATNTTIALASGTSNALPANTVHFCHEQAAGLQANAWNSRVEAFSSGYGTRIVDWKVITLTQAVSSAVAVPAPILT